MYIYRNRDDGTGTTTQVASIKYKKHGVSTQLLSDLSYTYDARGNITEVKSGSSVKAQYTYDIQNQLTNEVQGAVNRSYTYDNWGNIRGIQEKEIGGFAEKTYELSSC